MGSHKLPAAERASGILLHLTSLPGPHGIGDFGSTASDWIGWLERTGCRLWQILPLVPTGLGNSPYNGSSAFAGNPLLISLDMLVETGLLSEGDLAPQPEFPADSVDYEAARRYKQPKLQLAAERFHSGAAEWLKPDYEAFCAANQEWLEDYALFRGLKTMHGETAWSAWDPRFSDRQSKALRTVEGQLLRDTLFHRFLQFIFFQQWDRVRQLATSAGISIIGDIPIFVAHDSSDVWAHPELFQLDQHGNPMVVAGVPPDYFSETGQRWGNPLYEWGFMEAQGFHWWTRRLHSALHQADFVRLDHFRGFEAYWEIPRDAPTAATGRWVPAPGRQLFSTLRNEFGELPIIAEDLGVITPEVIALRDDFSLPGMRILQFGLEGGPDHTDLPPNYEPHTVAYTGTHDNNTARGWYEAADSSVRSFALEYLHCPDDPQEVSWRMVEAIWSSVANWTVAPMQDFLALDDGARMNFPGTIEGNWAWRVTREQLTDDLAARIQALNVNHER